MLKIFYISSSLYILFLMMRVYARTREREKAWKFGAACLVASAASSPLLMLIFRSKSGERFTWSFREVCYRSICNVGLMLKCLIVLVDLLHRPRISLRPSTTIALATDYSAHCNRFLLPSHSRLIPRILHPQLDLERSRYYRPWCRSNFSHLWHCPDSILRRLRMGVLQQTTC